MLSRRKIIAAAPWLFLAAGRTANAARRGKMTLCMHTNTSNGAGYRAAMEGWAKAGIKYVELNASFVDPFIKTDTLDGARKVLADNGLTPVHGALGVNGLLEPNPNRAAALENLKRRLDMFTALGIKKVYVASGGMQKLALDDYKVMADNLRGVGEIVKAAGMSVSVEALRQSPYMSTLLTALKTTREAGNVGVMFDFYHFWSGLNKLEDMDQLRNGEIHHVHFQDVPDMPRELLDSNTRIIPGDGVAPLNTMLRKLADKGYAGPLSVELFLPQFQQGDPYQVASEIRRKCEALMRRAGVI